MFAVVQFIENKKFQVLAVPMSWIKSGILMWPKMSNEKIEQLRITGAEFHGSCKRIPIIIWKKFRNYEAAEKAADELALREVSDMEGKKKKLKPQKKPPLEKPKDYNAMFAAHQQPSTGNQSNNVPTTSELRCVPSGKQKLSNAMFQTQHAIKTMAPPLALQIPPTKHARKVQKPSPSIPVLQSMIPESPSDLQRRLFLMPHNMQPLVFEQPTVQVPPVLKTEVIASSTSNMQAPFTVPHSPMRYHSGTPLLQQPQLTTSIGTATNSVIIDTVSTHEEQQSLELYCTTEDIIFIPETMDDQTRLKQHAITDNTGAVKYEDLKNDIKHFIQDTVEHAVKTYFDEHFSRLAALIEMNIKAASKVVPEKENNPVENHNRIDNEAELHDWNVKLEDEDLCAKYRNYFTRIIPPNSYVENGDNACYTIVDCLFTRQFWTRFTWTGISRGQKSKRGFREFGNVLQLLVDLVCIGDPKYSAQKLEVFCRTRLFRYSNPRSTNKRLRKSACRPARKLKRMEVDSAQTIDDPTEIVDVLQTASDEENDYDYQHEAIDQKSSEVESEHDIDGDDENFNTRDEDASNDRCD